MWRFYGRSPELANLQGILGRGRWFFVKVAGRRRIGKTTLIQRALPREGKPVFYVQIPDSAPAGVLSAVADALPAFGIAPAVVEPPTSLRELAGMVGTLARKGYVVALDEFQYFDRKHLREFTSHLQEVVDALSADAARVPGGLIVLGSLHTEMAALLEDRRAPLYSRTTDQIDVDHLDIASLLELVADNAELSPERLLFLWSLFEGVPKFYRDCYEQGVLGAERRALLRRMFFESSSPLRTEAEHWFLNELRGRYDVVLKHVARNPGCTNGDLRAHVASVSHESSEQVGGYIKVLSDKYRMLERKLPIFAPASAKRGRYYIRDNFLRAWLDALQPNVAAVAFRPVDDLVVRSDERLAEVEGHSLERLTRTLYQERSRKAVGDFPLTRAIEGYWDGGEVEIDLVAIDDEGRRVRFVSCKRNPERAVADVGNLESHAAKFLARRKELSGFKVELAITAPRFDAAHRRRITGANVVVHDLEELYRPLLSEGKPT
jgi:AAA+ ATPase superfamily predicted ATPase